VTDAQLLAVTDAQLMARNALLSKITAQTEGLIPDVTGGPRAHEIALTLVQLAAGYAAIVGSEKQ
jgi:hypothetical protein